MTRSLLRAVPPLGGAATDVLIENDRFAAFGSTVGAVDDVIDGAGFLMLPGPIESHAHIDKTLWGEPWRSNSAGPTLTDLIENERRVLRTVTTPTASRAKALVRHYVARGTTRLRTHVDVNPETGLGSVQALLGLRERLRDLVDIELVAFPQRGMLITPGTADLMDAAIGVGIETIGGIDPAGIGRDPIRHLETIFTIAERRGCAVDIHLHDGGELGAWQIERIVDFVAATGLQGRTMISHAYCLGELPPARQEALGRRLAEQRVALMTTGAVRQRAAAGAAAARAGRHRVPGQRRHPRCLVAVRQRRHAGTRHAARLPLLLGQGRRARRGARLHHDRRGPRAGGQGRPRRLARGGDGWLIAYIVSI